MNEDAQTPFLEGPLARELSLPEDDQLLAPDTEFEQPRGVVLPEVRPGYATVILSGLNRPVSAARVAALEAAAKAGVSIDFLKFTQSGLSFLCGEADQAKAEFAMREAGFECEALPDRSVVIARAVNMRDEEGLMARIISAAIESGAPIDHISDMHDRALIVTDRRGAEAIVALIGRLGR